MIRKFSSIALAVMLAANSFADDVPTLKISKSDGESAVVLSELLSIKYTDSDMVVNKKDGTKLVLALDDIIVMELEQAQTAINSVFPNKAEKYVITNLQGEVVSKGRVEKLVLPTGKGFYIISVGNESKKILIK